MTSPATALVQSVVELPDLDRRQLAADRLLAAEGAGHIVHDLPVRSDGRSVSLESRPWRVDPIPYAIAAEEFAVLATAVADRMRMLEVVLGDLYGERSLLADGIVDAPTLWGSTRYRLASLVQDRPARWLTTYSVDVVQDTAGVWHVIHDATDAPSGVGYALLDRAVTAQVHRDLLSRVSTESAPQSLDVYADALLRGLADLATTESPRIVVMSGGVEHYSFVEQSYLATRLGLNLAEGADLVVRQRRLWLRSLAGLEPVDVLFRRLEDDRLDPMEVNAQGRAGIPGVLLAAHSGGVQLANAHGCGVIEDPALADGWDDAGAWLSHLRPGGQAETVLRRIDADWRRSMTIRTTPCYDGVGVVERPVVLRLHAVANDDGIDVLAGGVARVLAPGDDPVAPTAATAKDLWVLGRYRAPQVVARRQPLPQVDLIASVPTRAAEALFWAGRAVERSEVIARALRVVLDRTGEVIEVDGWVSPALSMLTEVAAIADPADRSTPAAVIDSAVLALSDQLGAVFAEVSSVREFFSVTAGRVLARLAEGRSALRSAVALDAPFVDIGLIDNVLIDLASFTGLWNESVVHGPAWRFGEIGRRLERVFAVIDTLRGASRPDPHRTGGEEAADAFEPSFATRGLIEIVLASNESLVAYRRRHRSDVELGPAMHLLLVSERNPRAVAAALDVVRREADQLQWEFGAIEAEDLLGHLRAADLSSIEAVESLLVAVWGRCDLLARDIVSSRLASPVDPRTMGRS
ncbi:MAG: circularly permuted type 2 ATP-grasp protein [Ilumatobacteraceae bacterium]